MTDPAGDDIVEIARQYERVALAWSAAVTRMKGPEDAPNANRLFDEQAEQARRLSGTADGRRQLERLMGHDDAGVRLLAAATVLAWNADAGSAALRELADDAATPPAHAISAATTLDEHAAGRLQP